MTNITFDQFGDVLLPEDLCMILHLGKNCIYKCLASGTIPSIKIGKKYLIPKQYLLEYIESQNKSKEL